MSSQEGTKFTIDRKLFKSNIWFKPLIYTKVWTYMLGQANYEDKVWEGILIKRSQLIRSYATIARDCRYRENKKWITPTISTIRIIVQWLRNERAISTTTTPFGLLITINNYNKLQPMKKPTTAPTTAGQQQDNSRKTAPNKNDKNDKNDNIDIVWPITYLNQKTNRNFDPNNKSNQRLIRARYNEGRTLEDFKKVIDKKVAKWLNDEKMMIYLRPSTLFNQTNFENYLNEPESDPLSHYYKKE